MKFTDGNGNLEILIYVIALILGLALNLYRNYSKRKAKEVKDQENKIPKFPDVLFGPVFESQEPNHEGGEYTEGESEYTEEVRGYPEGETEYTAIDTVPTAEENLESIEGTTSKTEPIDVPLQEEGVAAFTSTSEQIFSDEVAESIIEITADSLYSAIADSEQEITGLPEQETTEPDEFDLGKAVIYSEILNAKYI